MPRGRPKKVKEVVNDEVDETVEKTEVVKETPKKEKTVTKGSCAVWDR